MSFVYRRRVQFAETDLAGLVHFTQFFRYMEEAEHALWRAAGMSIARFGEAAGWPRLSADCQFKAPLRFEDEFDVAVDVAKVTSRTLQYDFTLTRGATVIATGAITTARVSKSPTGEMTLLDVPADVASRLRAATESKE